MRRTLFLAWILAAAPLGLGGCHVEPAYGGKKVSCATDADCQSQLGAGYTCQPEGFCAQAAGGDGGTTDGGITDGGASDGGASDGGTSDGGTSTCDPACPSGAHCASGHCQPDTGLVVQITSPASGSYAEDSVAVAGVVNGAVGGVSSVTCHAGSATPTAATVTGNGFTCTLDISQAGQGDPVPLYADATDGANRTAEGSIDVVHDSQAPTVQFTAPTSPDGFYVPAPGNLAVTATASDATLLDLKLTWLDPQGASHDLTDCPATSTQATCSGSIPLAAGVAAPGTYTLVATATDHAGHAGTATLHFKVDGNPPSVAITQIPTGAVLRTQDVPIVVTATDAETSVASLAVSLVGAAAGGADLALPATAGNTSGQTVFTVSARNGVATPVLDAAEKTWPVKAVATDAWGNQGTATGHLTITRVAWRIDLNAGGGTTGSALSPAVAADGTVYVVRQDGTGNDTLFTHASGSGLAAPLGKTATSVLAGPVLVEDTTGVLQEIFLETPSVTSTNYTLESLKADGTQNWTYGGLALGGLSNVWPLGLPALGSSGQLYVPVRKVPLAGGNASACIYALGPNGKPTSNACQSGQTWTRAHVAALRLSSGDEAVAVASTGNTLVVSCAGGCSQVTTGTPLGAPAGGPMFSTDHYFLTGAAPSGAASGAMTVGFPLTANLATDPPDWSVPLTSPTTGALRDTNRITGGLQGYLWAAKGPTTPTSPPGYGALPLPTDGPTLSLSLGTNGRRYALVGGGATAYVVAYDGPPGNGVLWRFPPANANTVLPAPTAGTTAVLSPQGLLIVPDSTGGVTALITDSAHPAVGWANIRADAARTASTAH